jgi:hypothetical protein
MHRRDLRLRSGDAVCVLCYILSHLKAAYETLHRVDNICTDVCKSLNRNAFSSSLPLSCICPFLSLLRRDTVLFRRNVAVDVRGWVGQKQKLVSACRNSC